MGILSGFSRCTKSNRGDGEPMEKSFIGAASRVRAGGNTLIAHTIVDCCTSRSRWLLQRVRLQSRNPEPGKRSWFALKMGRVSCNCGSSSYSSWGDLFRGASQARGHRRGRSGRGTCQAAIKSRRGADQRALPGKLRILISGRLTATDSHSTFSRLSQSPSARIGT